MKRGAERRHPRRAGLWATLFLRAGLCALAAAALTACSVHPPIPPGDSPASRDYVGLSRDRAIARAAGAGATWRVLEEDGRAIPVTKEMRPDRLNFIIRKGVVVEVSRG